MKVYYWFDWLRRSCLILFSIGGVGGLIAEEPAVPKRHSAQPAHSPTYMRVHRPASNIVHLQIALKKFVGPTRSKPVIWLSGVSHLGENRYYRALQRHLEDQDLVLYEGVKPEGEPTAAIESNRKSGRTSASQRAKDPDSSAPSLQATLADSLGLAFQLDAIDYTPPHFQHSDLSVEKIALLMRDHTNAVTSGSSENLEFEALLELMDGNSLLGAMAGFAARLLGSSPKLRAFTKLMMIETIGQLEGDLAQMRGMPPELQRLMEVLIAARNQTVLEDVKKAMARRKPPGSISIFYGAAHMADLEKRLVNELHYRLKDETWLTAITVDVRKAGLSPAEVELVRSTVKWQLDMLQGPAPAANP